MYIEMSTPDLPSSGKIVILKVKDDDGSVVQTCTASPRDLDTTIQVLAEQFKVTGVTDKRFIGPTDFLDDNLEESL